MLGLSDAADKTMYSCRRCQIVELTLAPHQRAYVGLPGNADRPWLTSPVTAVRSVCEALLAVLAGLSESPGNSARTSCPSRLLLTGFEYSIGVLDDVRVPVGDVSTAFTAANCPLSKRGAKDWRRLTRAHH